MLVNVPFRVTPRPLTATMIATDIPAAISPYSIAVAPDASLRNSLSSLRMHFLRSSHFAGQQSLEIVAMILS
jgi:hypothetical protein